MQSKQTHFQDTLGNHSLFGGMQHCAVLKLQGSSPDVQIPDLIRRAGYHKEPGATLKSQQAYVLFGSNTAVTSAESHQLFISTRCSWLDLTTSSLEGRP